MWETQAQPWVGRDVISSHQCGGRRESVGQRLFEPAFHTVPASTLPGSREARLTKIQQSSRGAGGRGHWRREPRASRHGDARARAGWTSFPTSPGEVSAMCCALGWSLRSPLPLSPRLLWSLAPLASSLYSCGLLQASPGLLPASPCTFSSKPSCPESHTLGPLRCLSRETAGVTLPSCPSFSTRPVWPELESFAPRSSVHGHCSKQTEYENLYPEPNIDCSSCIWGLLLLVSH